MRIDIQKPHKRPLTATTQTPQYSAPVLLPCLTDQEQANALPAKNLQNLQVLYSESAETSTEERFKLFTAMCEHQMSEYRAGKLTRAAYTAWLLEMGFTVQSAEEEISAADEITSFIGGASVV